jgi:hypothetical protein
MLIQQFREAVYHAFTKRPDAALDLIDALTVTRHTDSPVALSTAGPFRRRFSSVYDVLDHSQLDVQKRQDLLYEWQPPEAETLAGYELYAVDTTPNPRPAAETLADRGLLKRQTEALAQPGLQFSWLVRWVQQRTSWVAPWDVQRVHTASTESRTAVAQVKALDACSARPKVVVADSRYANAVFLAVCAVVQTVLVLVRLRNNQALYGRPAPKPAGRKGPAPKHGAKLKLAHPVLPPDRTEILSLLGQTVRLTAWHGFHLHKLAAVVGVVVRVEFLKADGMPRYQRPWWLFWTGPETVPVRELCAMYLWRFAIEHLFRFLKQQLSLNVNRGTSTTSPEAWMWFCALAYWQLLLMRREVADLRPAWQPLRRVGATPVLTPGQVQRGAVGFLMKIGTPAAATGPAGKGLGRQRGYHPAPRPRYAVVRKSPKAPRSLKMAAVSTG